MENSNVVGVIIQSGAYKSLIVHGGDVVYAPPAFKGQQGAKGATKARFAMIAARLAANAAARKNNLEK